MKQLTNKQLIQKAQSVIKPKKIADGVITGEVGCALVSEKNNLYLGSSIHACCGVGFCAEHSAIASMVTSGEYRIRKLVAVSRNGVLPPCGRCRELMSQIDKNNWDAKIMVKKNKMVKLKDLMPEPYQKNFY